MLLYFDFSKIVPVTDNTANNSTRKTFKVKWAELDESALQKYKLESDKHLQNVKLDVDLFLCDDGNCKNHVHINAIDRLHANIVNALTEASSFIQQATKRNFNEPGWNEYCHEAHVQAREAFILWCSHGTGSNQVYTLMEFLEFICGIG